MKDWFFENAGKAQGPVSEADLRTLIADGHVPGTSRVWNQEFGQEWRLVGQTALATSVPTASAKPPPLSLDASPTSDASPTAPTLEAREPRAPATMHRQMDSYSPRYATLLALVPLFIMGLEMIAVAGGVSPTDPALERGGMIWTAILSLTFAYKDANAIAAAGLNPHNRTVVPFVLLTQVGYFLRRRAVTGLSLKPLWIWLGTFVAYVIWIGVLYG